MIYWFISIASHQFHWSSLPLFFVFNLSTFNCFDQICVWTVKQDFPKKRYSYKGFGRSCECGNLYNASLKMLRKMKSTFQWWHQYLFALFASTSIQLIEWLKNSLIQQPQMRLVFVCTFLMRPTINAQKLLANRTNGAFRSLFSNSVLLKLNWFSYALPFLTVDSLQYLLRHSENPNKSQLKPKWLHIDSKFAFLCINKTQFADLKRNYTEYSLESRILLLAEQSTQILYFDEAIANTRFFRGVFFSSKKKRRKIHNRLSRMKYQI